MVSSGEKVTSGLMTTGGSVGGADCPLNQTGAVTSRAVARIERAVAFTSIILGLLPGESTFKAAGPRSKDF